MKHKKLFAILTLVCFMFTLMPVAAFAGNAAEAKLNDTYITTAETTTLNVVFSPSTATFFNTFPSTLVS